MPDADVIVPVFNEEEILQEFYRRIRDLDLKLNLIFVDNASTDNSLRLMESFSDVTIVRHSINEGYGGSLIDGIRHSRSDKVIIIDADCEYPPEAIPAILSALDDHELVYTSRLLGRESADAANMPRVKLWGNRIISGMFNVLFRQDTTDLYTGCKGFKRRCVEGLNFSRTGFEHVLEFACLLSARGYRIVDIPVEYAPRSTGASKMSHLSETAKFLLLLMYYRATTVFAGHDGG